jgi:CheY-like chemotaxis protein
VSSPQGESQQIADFFAKCDGPDAGIRLDARWTSACFGVTAEAAAMKNPAWRQGEPEPTSSRAPLSGIVPKSRRKVILVVDADAIARAQLVHALERQDHQVYQAADGLEAAELAAVIPRPDLIVTESVMPRVDGFTLARIFRAHSDLRRVPIVFLSSRCGPADVTRGISAGARMYEAKPVHLDTFLGKLEKILG